ncbi:MAG: hypothetical protein A2Z24_00800 [Candidatus Woykebacteria bacterium RBG_16_44_10]|uniref:Uncharacterized protein n=1 Tax=Candidatus Woykebacteria bacterium RBG_16_44_10 TaxID=1802597 RepID=A0A1G1WFM5_9BACT|nr:MAG: hypothetical protein A2Z24_00800 [Candidatus Woykebacteria bacterium RBG_16_44_10]
MTLRDCRYCEIDGSRHAQILGLRSKKLTHEQIRKELAVSKETVSRHLAVHFGKRTRSESMTKHGFSPRGKRTRFYRIWCGLVLRCKHPDLEIYRNYAGKGIKCEWKSFEEFKDDMHESYVQHVKEFGEKETSIDRINSNGNYSKENCRWATRSEQARNRSTNFTYNGESMREASLRLGGHFSIVRLRIRKGWPVEKAFTTPISSRYRKIGEKLKLNRVQASLEGKNE